MLLLHSHPVLLLREALQLIARTDRTTNNITKDRFKFFIKICRLLIVNKFDCVISKNNTIYLIIDNTKLNYFHQ